MSIEAFGPGNAPALIKQRAKPLPPTDMATTTTTHTARASMCSLAARGAEGNSAAPRAHIHNLWELRLDTTLDFGKHKGSTYRDVRNADSSYCRFVLQASAATGSFARFQSWLRRADSADSADSAERGSQDEQLNPTWVRFGQQQRLDVGNKHKHESFWDIFRSDPD